MNNEKLFKTLTGKVISDKMDKTVTVSIQRKVKHPIYQKYVKRTTKIHVHDDLNKCVMNDVVTIKQSRPRSKTKSWELVSIIERANKI